MAVAATTIFAGVSAAASVGKAIHQGVSANKRQRRANRKAKALEAELKSLEDSRQEIINPFDNVTSLSDMIYDVSDELSNPYNNLSVATQAAEFQAEEADIALANTLDALQSSGASAGGATALAQAALQSKRGISASIEQQEAQNEKMRAQGEVNLQSAKMNEAVRVQGAQLGESRRLQATETQGRMYEFEQRESREISELNRVQAKLTGQEQASAAARADKANAITAGIGATGNLVGAVSSAVGEWDAGSAGAVTSGTSSGRNYTNSSDFSGFTSWGGPAGF